VDQSAGWESDWGEDWNQGGAHLPPFRRNCGPDQRETTTPKLYAPFTAAARRAGSQTGADSKSKKGAVKSVDCKESKNRRTIRMVQRNIDRHGNVSTGENFLSGYDS
jgi:hypothetical protein